MNMQKKIKRNNLITSIGAAVLATGLTTYAFAEPDYDRIKKDISVMIGIVKSSFDHNSDCEGCRVTISGHYLADQGVVFNVHPASRYASVIVNDEHVAIPDVPLAPMINDIIADVRMNFSTDDFDWEFNSNEYADLTREARHRLRESRHQLRELSREMREIELQAIHAEEDERNDLDGRRAEVEARIAEVERLQEEVESTMNEHVERGRQAREEKIAKRREAQLERFRAVEDIVLNTFCDYSSSMRNIPRNEKVSVIVKQDQETSNIYVFEQSELQECDSRKDNVRQHALSYAF